jgi:hypothetical protein
MTRAPSQPSDREALRDELLSAARRHVPDWTDTNDSDPGLLLLELFGWLAEVLAAETDLETRRRLGALVHHLRDDAETIVTVDGALWRPEDRTYFLETSADGTATIRFGDGESGRRPPAGSEVRVTYRLGGRAVTLTTRWPPPTDFRLIVAPIDEDGLSLRLAGTAGEAE